MEKQKAPTANEIFKVATMVKRQPYEIENAGRVWIHRIGRSEANMLFDSIEKNDNGEYDDPYDDEKVIVRCVRDENGKQIFKEGDLTRIAAMGNDIVLGLVGACLAINGMGAIGREATAKNLGTIRGSDSESE